MNPVIRVQLLLQLDYGLVALIQPGSQCDHNVALLQKKLLVPVDLGLFLLYLSALPFHLLQLLLVLLADKFLLLFQERAELWRFFYLLATYQHLRVERTDLFLESFFLFTLHDVLTVSLFKGINGSCLVLFGTAFLFLELQ